MFSKTFTLFLNWISKVRKQENTLVTEIEKGRSYGSQKTMMISIKIVLINAVIVHVHWNTKFQLFMKKKKDWFDKFWKKQKTMIVKIHMYVFFFKWKGSTLKTSYH